MANAPRIRTESEVRAARPPRKPVSGERIAGMATAVAFAIFLFMCLGKLALVWFG